MKCTMPDNWFTQFRIDRWHFDLIVSEDLHCSSISNCIGLFYIYAVLCISESITADARFVCISCSLLASFVCISIICYRVVNGLEEFIYILSTFIK